MFDPFAWWRRRKRRQLLQDPMPASWAAYFDSVPLYRSLSPDEQSTLRDKARLLIAEKSWEGCGGLAITAAMQVVIAAQAALLILHNGAEFTGLQSILVYPSAFVNPLPRTSSGGVVSVGTALHGEAWRRGPVVLDWDDTWRGVGDPGDGRNLVLHEFAHKLDLLDGFADGCPPLQSRAEYRRWHEVMTTEFAALQADDEAGRATVLDHYGAVNPAEFFAVATEAFFEKGRDLRARHAVLYAALRDYYRQDPAPR